MNNTPIILNYVCVTVAVCVCIKKGRIIFIANNPYISGVLSDKKQVAGSCVLYVTVAVKMNKSK